MRRGKRSLLSASVMEGHGLDGGPHAERCEEGMVEEEVMIR